MSAVLWFDGEWTDWWTEEEAREIYAFLRELKPDIIINNRVGKGRPGMEGLEQERSGVLRRLRHARAADSRHRHPGRRLGIVHDDERHVGVPQRRPRTGSRPRR